jgi:hypothetical protein
MKYMVLRIDDERSSELCKAIEAYAMEEGGLEFPFSFEGNYYDSNTLNAGLETYGEYHTKVFHENCRCSLVPISNETIWKHRPPDYLDMHMMIDSAIAEANLVQVHEEEAVDQSLLDRYSSNRIINLMKLYLTKFRETFRRFA